VPYLAAPWQESGLGPESASPQFRSQAFAAKQDFAAERLKIKIKEDSKRLKIKIKNKDDKDKA
jgi:hypothetical protein